MTCEYDHLYKILLIGDSGVGKSCLLNQFVDGGFNESHISTIGIDFKIKTLEKNSKKYKLQIWDTAGQERFRTITSSYYRGAHGFIIVFDLTSIESWNNISYWLAQIKRNCLNKISILIIGTKNDLINKRTVFPEIINSYVKLNNLNYIETSARNNNNIQKAFLDIIDIIINNNMQNNTELTPTVTRPRINIQTNTAKLLNKKCC
jgi:Ras-related protein Rab-1A